jgi:two-component system OmpR family sensor kinase
VTETSDPETEHVAHLETRIADLEHVIAARDSFIAVVAHELRNPMTPILGNVQRLRRLADQSPHLPTDFRDALGRLEWLTERYIRRATTLLDVSRIRMGKYRLAPEPVDFCQILAGVVESTAPIARHLRSAVLVTAPVRLSGICDRLAFEQIAENLITNALKYGEGRPTSVSLRSLEHAKVELAVTDQGPGIPASDHGRIFGKFEQVLAHVPKAGGFGVGLWIVRQLVDTMGGTIELDSEVGRGSTFRIVIGADQSGTPDGMSEP